MFRLNVERKSFKSQSLTRTLPSTCVYLLFHVNMAAWHEVCCAPSRGQCITVWSKTWHFRVSVVTFVSKCLHIHRVLRKQIRNVYDKKIKHKKQILWLLLQFMSHCPSANISLLFCFILIANFPFKSRAALLRILEVKVLASDILTQVDKWQEQHVSLTFATLILTPNIGG